jgi:hypothetical protein
MAFGQVRDLQLDPVLIQGFVRCPPSSAPIVGWTVGTVLRRSRDSDSDGAGPTPVHYDL